MLQTVARLPNIYCPEHDLKLLRKVVYYMDDVVGTCAECGGTLIYIDCLNKIVCDTCDYERTEVM